jgi:5-methylcytosine-specific restriction endonuclease McrA
MDCLAKGIVTLAVHVHHIKKLAMYPELKYEESNLMSLDETCHSIRTARGE